MQKWAVVNKDGVVVHGFDGPNRYVENYETDIVRAVDVETPEWYSSDVRFIDVTSTEPRPMVGWYLENGEKFRDGSPKLSVDRTSIPADRYTEATVTFECGLPNPPRHVTFDVNGERGRVVFENGVAQLGIVSENVNDVIVVDVVGYEVNAVTITVTEV